MRGQTWERSVSKRSYWYFLRTSPISEASDIYGDRNNSITVEAGDEGLGQAYVEEFETYQNLR